MERNREKRYVAVDVHFSAEGRLRPLQIVFDEERVYAVDQVRDVCRRAADVGGVGDRYTCVIQGQERYLWFERGRWFVNPWLTKVRWSGLKTKSVGCSGSA